MSSENDVLQARLKNCLVTIVEMEPMLSRLTVHKELLKEFKQLKEIATKVAHLELSDAEVERIEQATKVFLNELEIPKSFFKTQGRQNLQ